MFGIHMPHSRTQCVITNNCEDTSVPTVKKKMRANIVAKALLYCSILSVILLLYYNSIEIYIKYNKRMVTGKYNVFQIKEKQLAKTNVNKIDNETLNLKYILQWTSPNDVPFVYMGQERQGFIERNCSFTNCIVTANKGYLGDYTKFDLIVFAVPEVFLMSRDILPIRRSPHQKFVLASIESADNYPVCRNTFDGFFNWTWTYRLDSEAKWGYIAIRDAQNNIIGPKVDMNWMKLEDMDPVSDDLKLKIKNKTKAVAWFVSSCSSRSNRERFAWELQNSLTYYNLHIDMYGECGPLKCSRNNEEVCNKLIEKDYYFYLSFENSFAQDYATEKLLHALQNYAVPIVYGGANYSRFMPDGIYLNAVELGAQKLATKINELINNPDQYSEYFKWKKYYSYHKRSESEETDDYCRFCSMLNEEGLVKKVSVYENFQEWWDPLNRCKNLVYDF